ncbi:MAG: hypothetical protein D6744_10585 [Planctomycetota bacterium]|nr:MAG: hypothetical protein D6744_10585 [Planctomycetota bacterium]
MSCVAMLLVNCGGCPTQTVAVENCVESLEVGQTVTLRVPASAVDEAAASGAVWTVDRPDRGVFLLDGRKASSVTGAEAVFVALAQGRVQVSFAAAPSAESGPVAGFEGSCRIQIYFPGGSLPGGGFSGADGSSGDQPDDASADRDGDGTPDADDGCPDDPQKTAPGDCGCGVADVDADENGVSDCLEEQAVDLTVNVQFEDGEPVDGATVAVARADTAAAPLCQSLSDFGVVQCDGLPRGESVIVSAILQDVQNFSGSVTLDLTPPAGQDAMTVTVTLLPQ